MRKGWPQPTELLQPVIYFRGERWLGQPSAAPPAPLRPPERSSPTAFAAHPCPRSAGLQGPSPTRGVAVVSRGGSGWEHRGLWGDPASPSHSPCGLHQRHRAQPQHRRAPQATHFLDGGDLQQVEPLDQVKTCGQGPGRRRGEVVRVRVPRLTLPGQGAEPIPQWGPVSLPVTFSYLSPTRSSSQSCGHSSPARQTAGSHRCPQRHGEAVLRAGYTVRISHQPPAPLAGAGQRGSSRRRSHGGSSTSQSTRQEQSWMF